jgi:hypothetical protein
MSGSVLFVNEVMNAGRAVVVSHEVGCQRNPVEDGITKRVFPARNARGFELSDGSAPPTRAREAILINGINDDSDPIA